MKAKVKKHWQYAAGFHRMPPLPEGSRAAHHSAKANLRSSTKAHARSPPGHPTDAPLAIPANASWSSGKAHLRSESGNRTAKPVSYCGLHENFRIRIGTICSTGLQSFVLGVQVSPRTCARAAGSCGTHVQRDGEGVSLSHCISRRKASVRAHVPELPGR